MIIKKRIDTKQEIQRLDPQQDCQRIVFITSYLEFPWDMTRALELALFRTFAVPSIAKLLDQTGEFARDTQRRYDDTAIIINEIMVNGFDSSRGKSFIQRMNRIHGQYEISNDDFLYTLSTFVYEPIRWIDRFGWRPTYENERLALFHFWREVGTRMKISGIPETYQEFETFNLTYESDMFAESDAAQRVANPTRNLLLGFYLPEFLWKPAEPLVYSLMDEPLLKAMDYPIPPQRTKAWVEKALQIRARLLRILPKHKYPRVSVLLQNETHPSGYTVDDIGPDKLRQKWVK